MGVLDVGSAESELRWLYGLQSQGVKLGLRNIRELLRRLGDPQEGMRFVHVAGSDGKGSTSAIIASVLRASGYKVGLYTSPHILDFNERIRVDGVCISDADMARLCSQIRHFVDDMRESGMSCTFFEVTTAMALMYFREREADVCVMEVGMGGRFDATNVITPEVSVINNISLEHTEFLGDTIEKIAFEKAGIIKEGVPCVTINPEPAYGVIAKRAEEMHAPLGRVLAQDVKIIENTAKGPRFAYGGREHFVSIPGRNSAKNAALAMEALSRLKDYGRIGPHLDEGLSAVRWPCRMEDLGNGFIVDVTHTEAGSEGLAADIGEIYGKVTLVFGILKDKDADDICANLSRVADRVVVTRPQCPRGRPAEETLGFMRKYVPDAQIRPTVGEAMELAEKIRGPGEKVLVAGSFYMAEEALRWMGRTSA